MEEAASTSETSVNFYQTTWRNNPEDSHLNLAIPVILWIFLVVVLSYYFLCLGLYPSSVESFKMS
jgi:hypothetical protein